MAKKCARTFSIVVEKGKKSILDVTHLLPVGIARSVRTRLSRHCARRPALPAIYITYDDGLLTKSKSPEWGVSW